LVTSADLGGQPMDQAVFAATPLDMVGVLLGSRNASRSPP